MTLSPILCDFEVKSPPAYKYYWFVHQILQLSSCAGRFDYFMLKLLQVFMLITRYISQSEILFSRWQRFKKSLEMYIFFSPHKNPWCLLFKTGLQSQNSVLCVLSLAVSFLSPWRLQCQSYYRQIHQMVCQMVLIPLLISEWAFTSSEAQEGCEIKFSS